MATDVYPSPRSAGWTMRIPVWIFLFYIGWVVYGSLIPFELRPHTLPEAWDEFLHIRYLNLDVVSRADWIANIVLYIPLGVLAVGWMHSAAERRRFSWSIALLAFAACSLVAFIVEFLQIFFAPRTVSINDLIAEHLGGLLGIVLWVGMRRRLGSNLQQLIGGGRRAVQAFLVLYAAGYLILSLFPYDFIFSAQELKWKLATDNQGWLVASGTCQSFLRCGLKLIAEAVAALPLGVLFATRRLKESGNPTVVAFTVGVLLGILLEVGQLLTASGVAQGLSVVSRGIGVASGAWIVERLRTGRLHIRPGIVNKLLAAGVLPYLLVVLAANGWLTASRIPLNEGLQSLKAEMFLPFYFHYFSTEANAVQSLLANFALYFPVGLAYWLTCCFNRSGTGRAWKPAAVAACIAFTAEAGKLFLAGLHPDPTNVLIAAASAGLAWRFSVWLQVQAGAAPGPGSNAVQPGTTNRASRFGILLPRLMAFGLFGIVVLVVVHYPLHAPVLGLVLAAYAMLLWFRPALWLFCVPALLPVVNFAPWTGWLYVDELDLILLTTLAMNLWSWSPLKRPLPFSGALKLLTAMMATGYLISLGIGLLPLQAIDVNSFADYYSNYNALRVGKGLLWAVLLLPLIIKAMENPEHAANHFILGMLTGLAGVIAVTLWERWTFPGVLNFSSEFRTAAMFSEMHTGGAYIDAYLAAAFPFIAACFLRWRSAFSYVCGIVLFGLGLYAFLVTFSRTDYPALAISALVLFVGFMRSGLSERRFYAVTVTLAVIMALVLIPVLRGPYIQTRFATASEDFDARRDQWVEALDIRSHDTLTSVFGMGLGSYPRATYLYHLGEGMPQSLRYIRDSDNTFLRLGSGTSASYLLQEVVVAQPGNYRIEASIRPEKTSGAAVVMLCEKTLLYSLKCESSTLRSDNKPGQWTDVQSSIDVSELGQARRHPARPVSFSIYNPQHDASVDIDNIRLIDPNEANIIANGDFSHGQARWFFTVDDLRSWHIGNMWIQVLFEQGWFGLVLVTILIIYTLKELGRAAWAGNAQQLIMLSSLSGLLVIGVTDSLFDAPRVTLLFWMLVFFSLVYTYAVRRSVGRMQL